MKIENRFVQNCGQKTQEDESRDDITFVKNNRYSILGTLKIAHCIIWRHQCFRADRDVSEGGLPVIILSFFYFTILENLI